VSGSERPCWLVAGAGGMLGSDLLGALAGRDVAGLVRAELDVTDPAAVEEALGRARPDVVVNAAGWTAVDAAEDHEAAAFAANAVGPANLARACARAGARLVHVSTDYVFAGDATAPYAEDAPVAPRSAYGRTKAAGEWAVRAEHPAGSYVVRTAWLYGARGGNFVKTMLRLEGERDALDVVDDQRGQPTWSRDLAGRIVALVDAGPPPGIYHGTASGETTWYHLTRAIFELLGADPDRVRPTTTDRYPRPAPRPAYSVLGHDGWATVGIPPMRDWRAALTEAFPTMRSAARRPRSALPGWGP
jgi:dTDP-4-dehydrorhamnose reductase